MAGPEPSRSALKAHGGEGPGASLPRNALTTLDADRWRFRQDYRLRRPGSDDGRRYLVTSDLNPIYSGLGCLLRVLAPARAYAQATRRTLVIDWRDNPYTRDEPDRNLFHRLFETPREGDLGVPVIADDRVADLEYPQPFLTTRVAMRFEDGEVGKVPSGGLTHAALARIIADAEDVPCPSFLPSLTALYRVTRRVRREATPLMDEGGFRQCYGQLSIRPEWRQEIDAFFGDAMAGRDLIGLHIRHGNGEGDARAAFKSREIDRLAPFLARVVRVIQALGEARHGGRIGVFLATDSDEVVRILGESLPDVVTRRLWRPPPGGGIDFDHAWRREGGGLRAAVDALVDMALLARCRTVVATRRSSFVFPVRYLQEAPDARFLEVDDFEALDQSLSG